VTDPLIGAQLGHFQIEELIAEGGMGLIYRARHNIIGKLAAIKVLSEKYSSDKNMIKRLHREARAVNRIAHPNIIDIFDFGQTPDGREYFVMEYVPGKNLAEILMDRGRLEWSWIAPVLTQTLDALAAIHELGFIHRDIKPENLLVIEREGGRNWVKLLDFGITRSTGLGPDAERLTSAGSVMGTPEYVAPEQVRGKEVDGRVDLYAVGVMLFEMVMGERPFEHEEIISLLMSHLRDPIPPMDHIPPHLGVPEQVPDVVRRAMAKDPAERFPTALEFAMALDLELSTGIDSGSHPPLSEEAREEIRQRMEAVPASPIAATEPGAGVPPPPAAPVAIAATAAPQAQAAPTTVDLMPERPRVARGGAGRLALYLIPIVMLVLSGGAIAAYLMKGRGGPDGDNQRPIAVKPPTTDQTGADGGGEKGEPGAMDLPALYDRVRKVLRQGTNESVPPVRRISARGLGELRDREALPVLTSLLLSDPERPVQAASALAIAKLGPSEQAVEALRKARGRSDEVTAVWMDEALMQLDRPEGRAALVKSLGSRNKDVRFQAAMALGEAGDSAALKPLQAVAGEAATLGTQTVMALLGTLARLGHEASLASLRKAAVSQDQVAKLGAAEALARLGDEVAITTLGAIVKGGQGTNRLVAAKVLAGLGDYRGLGPMTEAVKAGDEMLRRMGAEALGSVSDMSALRPLQAALDDKSWLVRSTAAESLARILSQMPTARIKRSQDWLRTALANRDWSVRYTAAGISSEMDPELAVSLLGWALKDEDPRVRRQAVASLGRLRSRKAVALLTHALSDDDPKVRKGAASALGGAGDKAAADALFAAVQDSSPGVGISAAGALARLGHDTYVEDLKKAARLKDPKLRRDAIEALGRWESPRAEPLLREGLKDRDAGVRLEAALQLAARDKKSPEAVDALEKSMDRPGDDGKRALAALSKLGISTTATVKKLAASRNTAARIKAMESTPQLPTADALALLRAGAKDRKPRVRLAAAGALAKLSAKQKGAAPLLRILAADQDDGVRTRANLALAKLGKAAGQLDMGKVKPVKAAPLPERAAPEQADAKKGANPRKYRPAAFLEDTSQARQFKYHFTRAAVAASTGNYARALSHLKKAQRHSKQNTVVFEMAVVHLKMAIKKRGSAPDQARKHLLLAKRYFQHFLRKAPTSKQAPKAKTGLREVEQLLKRTP